MDCTFFVQLLLFFVATFVVVDGQMCTVPQRSNANFISDTNVSRNPGQPVRSGRLLLMNCVNGYRMEGNSQSRCTGTTFDQSFGNCVENIQGVQKPRRRCQTDNGQGCELEQNYANGLLVNSTNGRPLRSGSCLKIGEEVELTCYEQYELSNPFSTFAVCRSDGQFSSMTSICQLRTTTHATTMLDIETTEFFTGKRNFFFTLLCFHNEVFQMNFQLLQQNHQLLQQKLSPTNLQLLQLNCQKQ